jgi:magnesium-transporting ATPase (P-type)
LECQVTEELSSHPRPLSHATHNAHIKWQRIWKLRFFVPASTLCGYVSPFCGRSSDSNSTHTLNSTHSKTRTHVIATTTHMYMALCSNRFFLYNQPLHQANTFQNKTYLATPSWLQHLPCPLHQHHFHKEHDIWRLSSRPSLKHQSVIHPRDYKSRPHKESQGIS